MVKIKICGLKRFEDIEMANKYGPDYIGFVFADSKRKISHELAAKLKEKLNDNIISVGVFVDADINEIISLFNKGTIEIAQLHGSESEEYMIELNEKTNNNIKIIKAIEITQEINLSEYDNSCADYLLLDSGKGSGKTFDWELIKDTIDKDFFLAGGLNKSNVKDAILKFKPYAIDLSSALETDGYKDELKIKEIMEAIN